MFHHDIKWNGTVIRLKFAAKFYPEDQSDELIQLVTRVSLSGLLYISFKLFYLDSLQEPSFVDANFRYWIDLSFRKYSPPENVSTHRIAAFFTTIKRVVTVTCELCMAILSRFSTWRFFSREKAKRDCDWVVMSSVFVASQSSCFFLCSREQIRQVENRLCNQSESYMFIFYPRIP